MFKVCVCYANATEATLSTQLARKKLPLEKGQGKNTEYLFPGTSFPVSFPGSLSENQQTVR